MTNEFMYAKDNQVFIFDKPIILRGVGLGGWMLPEGYMWGSYGKITKPRKFEERVESLIGKEDALLFWEEYHKRFISDGDFELIKSLGFNSIRLPFNFRMLMEENEETEEVVFVEKGWRMIDYTIEQCKKNDLLVILDLHGAPGGQTGTNIDDSKYDKPELFVKEIFQKQTITLWKEIAKRYKDETQVIMYDLLNEPLPDWNKHLYKELMPLYVELINEIRAIDPHHMISLEGAHWATDFSMFTERVDDNVVLHFHKYWNSPELENMKHFLDKREELQYPLFMGEGGENDLYWYAASFKMYEQLDIGWNFWAYKKIDNYNSVISFKKDEGWSALFKDEVDVDRETAKRLLWQFLDNITFDNCDVNYDVVRHLYREDECIQFAPFYDYYGKGISFYNRNRKPGMLRKNDAIRVVNKDGKKWEYHFSRYDDERRKNDAYPYLSVKNGEWYNYTFYVSEMKDKTFDIQFKDLDFEVSINDIVYPHKNGVIKMVPETEKLVVKILAKSAGLIRSIEMK